MAIEEILIRGNSDGTIRGAHAKDYVAAGVDANGETLWVSGPARPVESADLYSLFGNEFAVTIAQVESLKHVATERDALKEQIRSLNEQIREFKGIPKFKARDLAAQFNEQDTALIAEALVQSPQLLQLYTQLQKRPDSALIPLDSETFQQGLAGLTQVLGKERVEELFAALNIDIATMAYVDPAKG